MNIFRTILGVFLQCLGLLFCLPGYVLITIGSWFVDIGDTLRLGRKY